MKTGFPSLDPLVSLLGGWQNGLNVVVVPSRAQAQQLGFHFTRAALEDIPRAAVVLADIGNQQEGYIKALTRGELMPVELSMFEKVDPLNMGNACYRNLTEGIQAAVVVTPLGKPLEGNDLVSNAPYCVTKFIEGLDVAVTDMIVVVMWETEVMGPLAENLMEEASAVVMVDALSITGVDTRDLLMTVVKSRYGSAGSVRISATQNGEYIDLIEAPAE